MAAWTLVKLQLSPEVTGRALGCLKDLLLADSTETSNTQMLHNVLDWMGEPALPLVRQYIESGGTREGKYGLSILGRVADLNPW